MQLNYLRQYLKSKLGNSFLKKIFVLRSILIAKIPNYFIYKQYIYGKCGVEIGGPSLLFRSALPIYHHAKVIDGVNFSSQTLWEGDIRFGKNYKYYKNKKGMQYIAEASEMSMIADETYEFLISSNCLEHVANPIKALKEWRRILKEFGSLILVLPKKEGNFDRRRPITPLNHLIQDYESNVTEADLTHLDEILKLHDLSLDYAAGSFNDFRLRSLNNYYNRGLHHHVFDLNNTRAMLDYVDFEVLQVDQTKSDYIFLAIKK